MRKYGWVVLILLVVSLGSSVRAQYPTDNWITYYDCSLNVVGSRNRTCGGAVYTNGAQSGAYQFREWFYCDGDGYMSQWYYWNGSSWTGFSGPPGPNC